MNPNLHKLLVFTSAYGVVQVLSQDLGVRSGKKQVDLMRKEPILAFMLLASAYSITEDIQLALAVVFTYFFLKYIYSKGVTSPVCFQPV